MSASWPRTRLTDLLGIELPIVCAGMGGGITAPALVAAISNSGALGNLGAGYLPPDVIRDEIRAVKALTDRPFAVNLMAHQRVRPLAALDAELHDQLDVVEAEGVPVFTITYGAPPLDRLVRLRRAGTVVIGTATTVAEAVHLAGLGVDAVVAQGAEAAGTRASFLSPFSAAMVGTMALAPQIVDAIDDVPVIAAGGIGDGRGVAAARMLGADGVQLGTAFLVAREATTPQPIKDAALRAVETDSVVTAAIHGRPGRALRNGLVAELQKAGAPLPYPHQYDKAHTAHANALAAGNPDRLVVWAGQSNRYARAEPAADIVARLDKQAAELLG